MKTIVFLLVEDDREIGKRIATLLQERFSLGCVAIQGNEEQLEVDEKIRIGHIRHMSHADLIQALLDDASFRCPVSSFDLIMRSVCPAGQFSISQPHRVFPGKFADVRRIPIPAQCKGARKKLSK